MQVFINAKPSSDPVSTRLDLSVSKSPATVIILRGAGGAAPELSMFQDGAEDARRFVLLEYPGWRRYIDAGYTADAVVVDVVGRIMHLVPEGPIYIVGISIGGHFGYAAALELQKQGREVGGFCAVDTFMMSTAAPSAGWRRRAIGLASKLILGLRFAELSEFVRTRFWRALLRLASGFLPGMLHGYAANGKDPWFFKLDPNLEQELSMRLLIQLAAPFVVALDRDPQPLNAPAVLLRTELTGKDDAAWQKRCPVITIRPLPGDHQTLFLPESAGLVRSAFVSSTRDWR